MPTKPIIEAISAIPLLHPLGRASDGEGSPALAQAKHRAPGRARRFIRAVGRVADWIENCWVGDLLGAAVIFFFMVTIPVFLPVIFEVFHGL